MQVEEKNDSEWSELERLLVIKEDLILQEWKDQPLRLMRSVRLFARAQAAVSEAEIELQEAEATTFLGTKRNGVEGIDKKTDDVSKNAVKADAKLMVLRKRLVELEHRLNILKGLVKAFEQRAMALKYVYGQLSRLSTVGED